VPDFGNTSMNEMTENDVTWSSNAPKSSNNLSQSYRNPFHNKDVPTIKKIPVKTKLKRELKE